MENIQTPLQRKNKTVLNVFTVLERDIFLSEKAASKLLCSPSYNTLLKELEYETYILS